MIRYYIFVLVCWLSVHEVKGQLQQSPLAPVSARPANGLLFKKLTAEKTGLTLVNPIDAKHRFSYNYVGGYAAGGLAIGDVDGDGLQDIFAVSGPAKNALYLQLTDKNKAASLRFKDVTVSIPGLDGGDHWGAGAALADFDNDGDLDLYIGHFDAPNQLWVNETKQTGEPVFVECAKAWGVDLRDASFMPSFVDYDLDGDLDLFVLGYQYQDPKGRPKDPPVYEVDGKYFVKKEEQRYYAIIKQPGGGEKFTNVGRPDHLFRNDGGHFIDVTTSSGLSDVGVGNSASWFDYNQDGYPDLYVANDFKIGDQFWHNNGDGTFRNIIVDAMPHTTWFSMGSAVADVNNNGLLDLLVTDMAGTTHYRSKVSMGEMSTNANFLKTAVPRQYMRNALFINTDTPRFTEAAYLAGLASTDWTWAVKLGDYDNDGRVDAFFTNGSARMFNHSDLSPKKEDWYGKTEWELWKDAGERKEENLAFRNLGNLQFENVSDSWGVGESSMSYTCVQGDLDGDGDLDLVVADLDQPIALYQNQSDTGHRIRIRLHGTHSNRSGMGAVVKLQADGLLQTRQMMPMTGFLSCNEPFLQFGLGNSTKIDALVIDWPSGVRQQWQDLPVDKLYTIVEQGTQKPGGRSKPKSPTLFAQSRTVPAVTHQEKHYDDFVRQPLLPYKHSQLGPGVAVGDIDGDGDQDFYMGRAKGSRRAIYTNEGGGKLVVKDIGPFAGQEQYEDMGALFFDADRDGDLDLYVVSGGVECEAGDPLLQDRLYINNDGKGSFMATTGALPNHADSGSVVVAGDVDRDGDLDLFVGSRLIPGKYPVTPSSRLLINESKEGKTKFVDHAEAMAPGLKKTGLVTSALWSDADGDGWLDLLVTHDWGTVKFYHNEPDKQTKKRSLIDRSIEAGVAKKLGWWNGIAGRDIDDDGDVDYLVTNFGLNTTYKASDNKPELLYYGDLDGSGKAHLVEAKFENGVCLPRRGLSCSSHAMPLVRQKVGTFHTFGSSSLQDIYTPKALSESLLMEANELESGWLINESSALMTKFVFKPLPHLAQSAPAFGAILTDFEGDGKVDAFLAQNFYAPQHETGRMDGGLSQWLRGVGDHRFQVVGPASSGISIRGDAKGAAVTDFNEDGQPDILVTVNDSAIEAYENRARELTGNRFLKVQLRGKPGNLECVGARVRLRFVDEQQHPAQLAEVHSGGSYLAQSIRAIFFGLGKESKPTKLEVAWPNGESSRHDVATAEKVVTIVMP
jgi:hypothetical protein